MYIGDILSFMTIQTGINNTSNEWFKPTIDKKILKKLSKRSDFEGWKHVIIFFTSLIILGFATTMFWGSFWFIPVYILYCTLWGGLGTIVGAVFGVGIIAYMEIGIVAIGWSGTWRQFFNGLIILLALLGHRLHGERVR